MKKLFLFLILAFALIYIVNPVIAAKPDKPVCTTIQSGELLNSVGDVITTGYDQWGYNYQALMFNGGYCDSYRNAAWCQDYKDIDLIMKWNEGWLSNKDCDDDTLLDRHFGYLSYIGSGAWLTNHMSGSYDNENNKWNVVGTWKWLVLGKYEHDLVITSQNPDGTFTATGGYPAGSYPYTSSGQTPEVITNGKVEGDQITFTTTYSGPYNPGYSVTVIGTINPDGTITGISPWEWHSTLGTAVKNICTWNEFIKIVAVPSDATLNAGIWYTADGKEIGPSIWGEFATIQDIYNDSCTGDHGVMYKSPVGPGFGKF